MPRTFRHNAAATRLVEPERCDHCDELPPRHLLYTSSSWTSVYGFRLCDACLPVLVARLERDGRAYQVKGA